MGAITDDLLLQIRECRRCPTIAGYTKFPLDAHGDRSSKHMLIGEAPGGKSIEAGSYWRGAGGKLLRDAARQVGVELEDVFYFTDVVKCWPSRQGKNRKPTPAEAGQCSMHLRAELAQLAPKVIVTVGKFAAEQLLKRNVHMASEHATSAELGASRVVIFMHPSQIDLHMKRSVYIGQFIALLRNLVRGVPEVLAGVEPAFTPEVSSNTQTQKASISRGTSVFTLPAAGNMITEGDIAAGRLRVTVDFKRYFPDHDTDLLAIVHGRTLETRFRWRSGRSHVWRIGREAMQVLSLRPGDEVQVTRRTNQTYVLEKV